MSAAFSDFPEMGSEVPWMVSMAMDAWRVAMGAPTKRFSPDVVILWLQTQASLTKPAAST